MVVFTRGSRQTGAPYHRWYIDKQPFYHGIIIYLHRSGVVVVIVTRHRRHTPVGSPCDILSVRECRPSTSSHVSAPAALPANKSPMSDGRGTPGAVGHGCGAASSSSGMGCCGNLATRTTDGAAANRRLLEKVGVLSSACKVRASDSVWYPDSSDSYPRSGISSSESTASSCVAVSSRVLSDVGRTSSCTLANATL